MNKLIYFVFSEIVIACGGQYQKKAVDSEHVILIINSDCHPQTLPKFGKRIPMFENDFLQMVLLQTMPSSLHKSFLVKFTGLLDVDKIQLKRRVEKIGIHLNIFQLI